ncbi:MAG: DUF389 domain-containing protein [Patescibacteria group bacterium]
MLHFPHSHTSLLKASRAEQGEAIEKLISATTFTKGYYLLLVLSVLIITPGLLIDNVAVVIGGMVIAPVLIPILSFALSIVARSWRGMMHSLTVLGATIAIAILLSYITTRITAETQAQILWIPANIDPQLYFFIAFCSGIAAAFAWVKEDIAPTIAGITISVSLLPPLCATGIAAGLGNLTLARTSLQIFLLNVSGILIAAVLVFILLGFIRSQHATEKAVQNHAGE